MCDSLAVRTQTFNYHMMSNQSTGTVLAPELWTRIAHFCDDDTVRTLCSNSVSRSIRESALLIRFRDLSFTVKYLFPTKVESQELDSEEYRAALVSKVDSSRERFDQLSSSRFVSYVRYWWYEGSFSEFGSESDDDPYTNQEPTSDQLAASEYNDIMWPIFTGYLPKYNGLTALHLQNVDIDDKAVVSVNALGNLQTLGLEKVKVSTAMNLGRRGSRIQHLLYAPDKVRSDFIVRLCATLTTLELHISKADCRFLYNVLQHCPALEKLIVVLSEEEYVSDRPTPAIQLPATACPKLSQYIGPAYYAADIITGRPVTVIKVNQTPQEAEYEGFFASWIHERFGRGSAAVKSFEVSGWKLYALAPTFPVILENFPLLEDLRILVSPRFLVEDINPHAHDPHDKDTYERWHYLTFLHNLTDNTLYRIPPTLHSLAIVSETHYNDLQNLALAPAVEKIINSEKFANLLSLTVGSLDSRHQTWKKSEYGLWTVVQHEQDDPDGKHSVC